jgi:hypothetical protein
VDGANVGTLVNKARAHSTVLLVVRDSNGAVFGALVTEHLKMGEREKYYGNGTTAVWALRGDAIKVRTVLSAPPAPYYFSWTPSLYHRITPCHPSLPLHLPSTTPGASATPTS